MGTHAITYIVEGETPIAALYCQYDGYVSSHGHTLAKFLDGKQMVNGFGADAEVFNGLGDLGARLFCALKGNADEVGGWYLRSPNEPPDAYEYGYYVSVVGDKPGTVRVSVVQGGRRIFRGTPAELLAFNETDDD